MFESSSNVLKETSLLAVLAEAGSLLSSTSWALVCSCVEAEYKLLELASFFSSSSPGAALELPVNFLAAATVKGVNPFYKS